MASDRVCIIGDSSKRVERLGAFPLPVEIVGFGLAATLVHDRGFARPTPNARAQFRSGAAAMASCSAPMAAILLWIARSAAIPDAELLADLLDIIPGVMEHGLFIGIADEAVLAGPSGLTVLRAYEEDL